VFLKLMYFMGPGCNACRISLPIIQRVATELSLPLEVVDVFLHPEISHKFGVRSLPTTLILCDDEPVDFWIGCLEEANMLKRLLVHVAK